MVWWIGDLVFEFCERKLPAWGFETLRWILVPISAAAGMIVSMWFWEGGILWPFFAWPGLAVGAAFMAPRRKFIVGGIFWVIALLLAWHHGSDAWEKAKTRRWLADIFGLGVAGAGVFYIRKIEGEARPETVSIT